MGCNRDSGCLKLYSVTYPNLESEINTSISSADGEINEIISELSNLYVPDDYLGNKVQNRLQEICNSFSEDSDKLKTEKNKINSFINTKIEEHRQHYNSWQKAQEIAKQRRMAKLKEDDILSSKDTKL